MKRLTVLVVLLIAVPAVAAVAPVRGEWRGTSRPVVADGAPERLTLRVVREGDRFYVRSLRTTTTDTCVDPGSGEQTTFDVTVRAPRMLVKPNGEFRTNTGEVDVDGEFTARRRVEGTLEVAPTALNCSGAFLRYVARPR